MLFAPECSMGTTAQRMIAMSKACAVCPKEFTPVRPLQRVCSVPCAILWNEQKDAKKKDKAWNKETRRRREKAKTVTKWLSELQAIVNRYVRLRDRLDGCVSCFRSSSWQGQWHCSHYYPTSTSSAVRFNLWNMHKSCSICNAHLSGNIGAYTPRLIEKIGQRKFDWLELHHNDITKYDIAWIKRAIIVARKGVRRLERRIEQ